ncbi:MAG: hypothetical protein KBA86_04320 [Bacteroidales bacterium]|nr:hypothetical protein [Bacteroidales bacterium]
MSKLSSLKARLVLIVIIWFLSSILHGQNFSNRVHKTFLINSDSLVLDTVSIVPGSLVVENIDTNSYAIDYQNALFIIIDPLLKGHTINLTYRTLPIQIHKTFQHKSTAIIEKNLYDPINPLMIRNQEEQINILNLSDATFMSTGSLSRGITMGNNQDIALNSNLNLQLSGQLSEDVKILANITDKNIPIQPEGNTRQIQEFDKIFIELIYKEKISLLAGDIEAKSQDVHFMKFTKKGQGLLTNMLLQSQNKQKDTINYHINISGAIAKGTFHRQTINAIEGNQGPYQLRGINNETFIIILSGSERIYIDGRLLTRGQDADYIINYNSGEITFTAKQPITKDKRIVAEFEYSDFNYTRGLSHISTTIQKKKWDVSLHFYHEQDFKNQSNQMDLTDENISFLQKIGNNIGDAYFPFADSTGYQINEILYKKIDTLVNGIFYDSVYIYSTNSDSAFYSLRFTLVGEGKGNYVLTKSAVNGRVYTWIAPIGGIPQGNYEPVILLITPKRTQMYTVTFNYKLPKNTKIHIETALSNNDMNTFSNIGNAQNIGIGLLFSLNNTLILQKKKNIGKDIKWKMHSSLYYESKNKLFDYIENYRDVEFIRNFNLNDSMMNASEHYAGMSLLFDYKNQGKIGWTSNVFFIPEFSWNAIRNQFYTDFKIQNYTIKADVSLLTSESKTHETIFLKHKEMFSRTFTFLEIGIKEEMEFNQLTFLSNDSISPQSYAFNEISLFLKQKDSINNGFNYLLEYSNRMDKKHLQKTSGLSSIAHNVTLGLHLTKFTNHTLGFTLAYRNLSNKDSSTITISPENMLLANVDYQGRFLKGAIHWGLFYELGSGMEQKNAYSYLKVADGQGVYQWIDYNKNGIEELDEFEVAVYKDKANYIRIWLLSNEFIKTYNNRFTQSLALRPAMLWMNSKGFRKFLSRFANITTYQTQVKQIRTKFTSIINPFYNNINDTMLVTSTTHFRNAFSFNQSSSVWGIDIIYTNSKNKVLTVNGFETTNREEWQFTARWSIFNDFIVKINYYNSFHIVQSEYFNNKNFRIKTNHIEPVISYQFDNKLSINLLYAYIEKINRIGIERLFTNKASTEINYRFPKRGILYAQLIYYHIVFKGLTASSIAYEMMESLQPGHNGVFSLNYQTNIFKNLQINLMYEGRVSPKIPMIHTGGIEIRAFF